MAADSDPLHRALATFDRRPDRHFEEEERVGLTSAASSGSAELSRLLSSKYSTCPVGHSTEEGGGRGDRGGRGREYQSIEECDKALIK